MPGGHAATWRSSGQSATAGARACRPSPSTAERRAGTSKLTFDALRLPDGTFFIDIPKRKRLRCSSCGRRAMEISASWSEVATVGNGRRPVTGWVVVIELPGDSEGRSNPLASEERAMSLAYDLADKGDVVLRIEGPGGDVSRDAIEAARAPHP